VEPGDLHQEGDQQLEEELVPVATGAVDRGGHPAVQLLAAGLGEGVDGLVGPVPLGDRLAADQLVADQPVQDLVEVAGVERPPLGACLAGIIDQRARDDPNPRTGPAR
jgi:hypothetical protein